jgi:starvation-inducible outer membrane lipoprotein
MTTLSSANARVVRQYSEGLSMSNTVKCLSVAAFAVALSACASSPESIKAANIDSTQFAYLTCPQLSEWQGKLTAAYNTAADSQNNARAMDAVGLLVLGAPIGSMTHRYTPDQIADLKGRLAAVQQLQTTDHCDQRVASTDTK